MFALVRDLANRAPVTQVAVSDWLVQRHNLGPLTALAGVTRMKPELARATLAWRRISDGLPPIIERWTGAGIRVAPIKGVAYAAGMYDRPAERPMTDIDLLVDRSSYSTAGRLLTEAGFSRIAGSPLHHASAWVRGDMVIDLHRGIVGRGRSRIDLDAVWRRTSPGWPSGALRLDPVDELVFHLLHMARNRLCGPLIQVVDVARLIERLPRRDPENALRLARTWRVGPAAEAALRFSCNVLDARGDLRLGIVGPTEENVLAAGQPSILRKLVFDVSTAGSVSQLATRVIAYGASRLSRRA